MERRLVLLRHAKSDWPAGVPDHARPLGDRGRREAPLAGRWLAANALVPDVALVSSAVRTQQTWDLVGAAIGTDVPVEVDGALYDAEPDEMLQRVRRLGEQVQTALVVAHNPGTERLALLLDDGQGPPDQRTRMATKFPTSALAVLHLLVPRWADLGPGRARLHTFVVPR